jgi:pyruvate kinase
MIMSNFMRRTKILATIGPSSHTPQMIQELILTGADGFRLNFSHGSHEYFHPLIGIIRDLSARLGKPVAILQDLQGPKIRVGKLKNGIPVKLIPGAKFVITTRDVEGNDQIISTTYQGLPKDVRHGDVILIDDGSFELKVVNVKSTDVETEVIIGGLLKEKKGINLPGVKVSASSLTEKDIQDARFGAAMDVDYIALSFVRTAPDIQRLKELLHEVNKPDIRIIAKIEKPEAIDNLQEILNASDGVMVARGDLGVELPAEKVPLLQKMIIEKANKSNRLVFTATQMLESMVNHARPTRAEASDVANAILDGTDGVMLSGETAIGQYPIQATRTMATIAGYTETEGDVFQHAERIRPKTSTDFTQAVVHSARSAADVLKAVAMIVFTRSGQTAFLASCQRPRCPIYCFTPYEKTRNILSLVWGVHPILLEEVSNTEEMFRHAQDILLNRNLVQKGDPIVIVSGTHRMTGATNMMKLGRIGESSG